MDDDSMIQLKAWNSTTSMNELTGESVTIYAVARSMTVGNFVKLFDEWLNLGGKQFAEGKLVGLQFRFTHRSLQRLAVAFALGLIAGISEQTYTDARNETAILTSQKIAQLMHSGELPLGPYL